MWSTLYLVVVVVFLILWWLERGSTTRSHPEHGSEMPQRRRYWRGNSLGKYATARGFFVSLLKLAFLFLHSVPQGCPERFDTSGQTVYNFSWRCQLSE